MKPILDLPGGLGRLKDGERTVEVRFTNTDGNTEVWIVKLLDGEKHAAGIIHAGVVWQAYLDDGVDIRVANQRNIIDRMWKHLSWHHNDDENGTCPISSGQVKLP